MSAHDDMQDRRRFLGTAGRLAAAAGVLGVAGGALGGSGDDDLVWQIDPEKCVMCGRCATECVLTVSAVKCLHNFDMCGYCNLCFGFFEPGATKLDEGAENQTCPTGAIVRELIEDPYFEYHILEDRCIGCSKCVKTCTGFGNGSLFLQVKHDRCLNCNECAIAQACVSQAFTRIPASEAYIIKGKGEGAEA